MALATLTVKVRFAWWVWPYVNTCIAFARLTGLRPDVDKIVRTAVRGLVVSI